MLVVACDGVKSIFALKQAPRLTDRSSLVDLDLDDVLAAARELPPLQPSVARLAQLVSSDFTPIADIVDAVSLDEALTLRVLRVANSVAYGGRRKTRTVREALVRLGTGRVLSLAIATHVGPTLHASVSGYGIGEGQLWSHSVTAALAVEQLSRLSNHAIPSDAFTAALLHDVGKLILDRYLNDTALELLNRARAQRKLSLVEAELEVLGVHHGELGGIVADRWGLPLSIVEGITHHHCPAAYANRPGAPPKIAVVCLATHIGHNVARSLETANGNGARAEPNEPQAFPGLSSDGYQTLCEAVQERLDAVLAVYEG